MFIALLVNDERQMEQCVHKADAVKAGEAQITRKISEQEDELQLAAHSCQLSVFISKVSLETGPGSSIHCCLWLGVHTTAL